jgi:soluble P-type ATPase
MSGTVGFTNVETAIVFVGYIVAGGIVLFKKRNEIVAELKDVQIDEVVSALVGPGKDALVKILDAAKS